MKSADSKSARQDGPPAGLFAAKLALLLRRLQERRGPVAGFEQ